MADIPLLRALSTKENYTKFRKFIKDHVISNEMRQIIRDMDSYYTETGLLEVTPAEFSTWFKVVKHKALKPEKVAAYDVIFSKWEDDIVTNPTNAVTEVIVTDFIKLDYYVRVMDMAMKGAEGDATISINDIQVLIDEFNLSLLSSTAASAKDLDVDEVSGKLSEHIQDTRLGNGLEWRLEELNISCGPLRKGDFVEIAAFVDSGKTSFLMSEATYMAQQLEPDEYVVWINNEERGGKLYSRIYQATLGKPETLILGDVLASEAAYETAMRGNNNKIRIKDNPVLSVKELEAYLERVQPKLIIIDMLDKVKGFEDSQRDDIRLQKLYQWAREMAKKYGPVIAATQVDGSAANQKWIRMEQLAGSRVAKQGEADAIITIGRIEEDNPADKHKRYIHIPKNKLSGGVRSDDSERNGHWEVEIQPSIARYKGTM